jgi:hypothetical protein
LLVDAGVAVIDIKQPLAVRIDGSRSVEKGGKLGIGDRCPIDLEGLEVYRVLWLLVRRACIAAHEKRPGRNPLHDRGGSALGLRQAPKIPAHPYQTTDSNDCDQATHPILLCQSGVCGHARTGPGHPSSGTRA